MSLPVIPGIIFIKEKPDHPPSYAALMSDEVDHPFFEKIWDMLKDADVVLAMIAFGVAIGFSQTISIMI